MTTEPSPPPAAPGEPPAPSNGIGTAGFVVSLAGLVLTCGILCPVGLILSLFGLRREPRGLAVAGAVIGAVGTMLAVVLGLLVLKFAFFVKDSADEGRFEFDGPQISTEITLEMAEELIDLENAEKSRLPTDEAGTALLESLTDGWGHSLRYERGTDDGYTIRSAGEDGAFETADDVTTSR